MKGSTGPIEPENGQIELSVRISSGCPDHVDATFVSPATATVTDEDGDTVFVGTIPF